MKLIAILTTLIGCLSMTACTPYNYLDYKTKFAVLDGYKLEPVLSSEAPPVAHREKFRGVWVDEDYPIIFTFQLESGLEKRPVRFTVSNVEFINMKGKKLKLGLPKDMTEKVNRPEEFTPNSKTLTMNLAFFRSLKDRGLKKEEFPFEDYTLKCHVRIDEEGENVLEKDFAFFMKSKIVRGVK